jgi:Tol biopolymer transport system component
MSDMRELLRPGVEGFEPMPDAFERVLVRRDRKRRNQRIAAGIVGIAVFAIAAAGLVRLLGSEHTPAVPEPTQPRIGNWVVFSALHLDPDPDAPVASRGKKFNLYVAGPDGNARLLVHADEGTTTRGCPAFSPDGSLLAYSERTNASIGGGSVIVVTGFTSSGELHGPEIRIPVPRGAYHSAPCPSWAPVGQRLAVFVPRQGVLFAEADGTTSLVRIDDVHRLGEVAGLEWSPDGSQVALLPMASYPVSLTLWVVPADGGAPRPLTGFDAGEVPNTIAWAADARSVVVGGSSGPSPFVKVVDAATGDTSDVPLPPAWDGSSLLQIVSTGTDRFLVMRAAARWLPPEWLDIQGHVTPIGELRYEPTSYISVSPDGTQMLYVTYDPAHPSMGQALVAVPIDGGEPTRYSPWTPQGFGDNYSTFGWQPG